MGGQLYVTNRLTKAYAQQDILLFRKILHTGLAIFVFMPLVVFLLFTAVIVMIPPELFLPLFETEHQTIVWVLAILGFQFVFSLPLGILIGVYRAVGLLPRGVMLSNLILLLQLGLVAAGLWIGGGMVWIAVLQALPYLLVAAIAAWELNKRFTQFDLLSLKEAEYSTGLAFIKPSLHFFSIQVAQVFSIQGMILVVGSILTPLQVVTFSTTRGMIAVMRQLLGLIGHSAWPEMTRLDAQHNSEGLYILFRAILRSSLIFTGVLVVFFHFFGAAIYQMWLGDAVEYQSTTMNLFLVYFWQMIFWSTSSFLLMAVSMHHTLSKILLASSLVSITLAYFLSREYSTLESVLIGMIVSDLLLPFWSVPYLVSKYQPQFSLWFFIKELVPVTIGAMSVILLPWVAPIVFLLLFVWGARNLRSLAMLELSARISARTRRS